MRCQKLARTIIGFALAAWIVPAAFPAGTNEEDLKKVSGKESWDYRYDISSLAPGKYNLIIEGTDRAGNAASAGPFNVYVDPASDLPVASISTPAPGQRVGGDLTVVGTCVDDDGVDRVEVSLDKGNFAPAEGKDYWSWSLPVASVADGPHTVSARGVDINGVTGTAVTVTFNLDTRAPLVHMTSHKGGALVGGSISLAGTVEDANGVAGIAYSADNRSTFLPLPLQADKGGTSGRYALTVDTRRLKDGPHVYWFRAADRTGSVGTLAFLFFVDNTGPVITVLSPTPETRSSGVVTVVGKITELVGIQSLSWNAGEAGAGPVELVPGNPYWVQSIDLGTVKGSSARVAFTAVDRAGNSFTRQLTIALLPDEADLPVVTLRSPAPGARFAVAVPLVGTARDDDGVKAIAWSVDGKPGDGIDSTGGFSTALAGLAAGRHRVTVHAIDVNGRAGKDVAVDILVTGAPPVIRMDSVAGGGTAASGTTAAAGTTTAAGTTGAAGAAAPVPFRTGQEIARDRAAVLRAVVTSRARIQAVTASFNGVPAEKPALKQGASPADTLVDVKVPPAVPFGLVTLTLSATDEYGQATSAAFLIHVTNYTRRVTGPGIQFSDARIRTDGTVALAAGGPLSGIMAGEDIASVTLDPPTDIVSVAADGDRIVITPARPGTSAAVRVKVTTRKGHVFTSDPWSFVTDQTLDTTVTGGAPAVSLGSDFSPGMMLVVGSRTALSGSVTFSGTIKAAEYSLAGGAPRPLAVRKPDKAGTAGFDVPLPGDLPHGRIDLRVSVTDDIGRRTDYTSFFYRVEQAAGSVLDDETLSFVDPRIADGGLLLLSPGDTLEGYYNGRSISSVALEPDTPFLKATADGNRVVVSAAAEGSRGGVIVRITTVDGDSARSEPLSFRVDSAPPALVISSPQVGAWTQAAVTVTGTATDTGGLSSLGYSIGEDGSFTTLPLPAASAAGAFQASVDLSGSPDGDVPIVVRAQDMAGRTTTVTLVVLKDTVAPVIAMLTPPAEDPVNGIVTLAGTAADAGIIDQVSLSTDGTEWSPASGTAVFSTRIDLSKVPADAAMIRATDRAGNAAVLRPTLNVQQAADVPDLQVQAPQDGDVQRNDFLVSGTVLDDDGVGAILYRIDDRDIVRLPGASTFSIPVSLADLADNEHTIVMSAEDLNGVASQPKTIVVRVSHAEPESRLVTPALDSTARGVITMAGQSSDGNGIAQVELSFDNGQTYRRAAGKESWSYRLDTGVLKDGSYSVFVRATDGYGTVGLASTLLNIDNTPPDVIVDEPADGASLAGSFTLAGRARDDIMVSALSARIRPLGSTAAPQTIDLPRGGPFSKTVDISGLTPGWYDLSIEALDRAANAREVSRNILVQAVTVGEHVDLLFPGNGQDLHGPFTVSGAFASVRTPDSVMLQVDGKDAGAAVVKDGGYFSGAPSLGGLGDGAHTLQAEARFADGSTLRSEPRTVTWEAAGPWVRITSNATGDWVNGRPFISGEAGRIADPAGISGGRLLRVDISLDNGRTFSPAQMRQGVPQGTAAWKYRLEALGLPDGPVRILVRAVYADGQSAVDQTILRLDKTPPQIQLLSPREEGRFNGEIVLLGTASDENGVAEVRAAVRKGDKANYEVPAFVQGLYFDGHVLGATDWDVGMGLTFFDQNVKLQAQVGMAPAGRFSGLMIGGKLLANIVRMPFSWFLGPDFDFLSASFAVGADFSYVTNSGATIAFTDQGVMLGAVVAQVEFPIVRLKSWPVFNTWSTYAEYQLWFISSDVSAGVVNRLAFGVRVGLF